MQGDARSSSRKRHNLKSKRKRDCCSIHRIPSAKILYYSLQPSKSTHPASCIFFSFFLFFFFQIWGDVWCGLVSFGELGEQEQATAYVTAELMRLTNTYLVPGCRPSLYDWAVRWSASGSAAACIACRAGNMPLTQCRRRQRLAPRKE